MRANFNINLNNPAFDESSLVTKTCPKFTRNPTAGERALSTVYTSNGGKPTSCSSSQKPSDLLFSARGMSSRFDESEKRSYKNRHESMSLQPDSINLNMKDIRKNFATTRALSPVISRPTDNFLERIRSNTGMEKRRKRHMIAHGTLLPTGNI